MRTQKVYSDIFVLHSCSGQQMHMYGVLLDILSVNKYMQLHIYLCP